jgi:DNA-binding ferritin-like protein
MTDKERLEQLELLVAELLQKVDRTSERIVKVENKQDSMSTAIGQLAILMARQSENTEYVLRETIAIRDEMKEMKSELKGDIKEVRDDLKEILSRLK